MGSSQKFGLQWRLRKSLMLQMKGKLTPYWKCQNSLTKLFYFFEAMNTCSFIRRFNFLMSFVGDKKRVKSMLKDNATVFSNAENMLFGPKYEELVAKSLSSKTRSKELFGSKIYQELSKEGSRRQPFCKGPLFRSRGNRGRGIFIPAGQTLQQQYPTGGQERGKNEFINRTFHQLGGSSVCIRILQSSSTNSKFISGKNQATAQSWQSETFCRKLAKTDKQSHLYWM